MPHYQTYFKLFREPRKTYCAGISCVCEPRVARALLRFSAQHLLRSLRFFEVPFSLCVLPICLISLSFTQQAFAAQASGSLKIDAPNVVIISEKLITSGQPSKEALEKLGKQGIQGVIYLAPPSVRDAIKEEPAILAQQGIHYINIPIQFDAPTAADFAAFTTALKNFGDKKVLVHCQVNMRASSMTFLYRTIHQGVDPEKAYESVSQVWQPDSIWRKLISSQLQENKISFNPI